MIAVDTSVLVAALIPRQSYAVESVAVINHGKSCAFAHALTETFSILTGGRLPFRIDPGEATRLIKSRISPMVEAVELHADDLLKAFSESKARGIRGGAIYDYLHLFAARKAGAERFYTLNSSDFMAFHRKGDPVVFHPGHSI